MKKFPNLENLKKLQESSDVPTHLRGSVNDAVMSSAENGIKINELEKIYTQHQLDSEEVRMKNVALAGMVIEAALSR